MYTKEKEEIALREYERLGSIAAVIRRLGYPSVNTGCTLPSARTFSATSPEKSSHLTAVVFHLWDDIL